jgi:predicted metal-binding membrane protein
MQGLFVPASIAALSATAWVVLWRLGESPWGHWAHAHAVGDDAAWPFNVALGAAFITGWIVMTAAMMLPTTIPLLQIFRRVTAERRDRLVLMLLVIAGYVLAWLACGVAVFGGSRVIQVWASEVRWLTAYPQIPTAVLFLVAGGFQFSALKYRCLDKCRSPLSFVTSRWRGTHHRWHSFRLGVEHGAFCVGCCWALMLLMFVSGTASLLWMIALGGVMAVEKNAPWGRRLSTPVGAVLIAAALAIGLAPLATARSTAVSITLDAHMHPPRWAVLERQLLADNVPACREFFDKYFDDRGYLQCFVRWGANDGPDDAFENFNRWPELHALGSDDEILRMYSKGHEGLLKQFTEAKTTDVPIAREGMYHKEFIVQSDWMHHGEGLQLFNRMGLSVPADAVYQRRARRFAGLYMGEDPDAPNYDAKRKIIRSMQNGSRGPMLRQATPLDWVGDPFDVAGFDAEHGESSYAQFLAHYQEYTDVVGDHFLNLAATTLATNAYLIDNELKYKRWLAEYMDAWLDRMRRNGGVIPSFVDLDGKIGGPQGRWWGNAYGWGFSPINPVTGAREDRNRIQWAVPGFFNALLVTGEQKYVDAWRGMIDAVNSNARKLTKNAGNTERKEQGAGAAGQMQYPSMYGANGWYGWRNSPWDVGALEVWYWSQKPADLSRVTGNRWVDFLNGKNADYPEQALQRDLEGLRNRLEAMRRDSTPPEKRLADNMLDYNPAATESLVQLMWGALMPGRPGGLLNARLRYFDPDRKRAGVPEDVAALVTELSDSRTTVTLINLNTSQARTIVVQGGGYGEHQLVSVTARGVTTPIDAPLLTVHLKPGSGETIVLSMKRYANAPTIKHPWDRRMQ